MKIKMLTLSAGPGGIIPIGSIVDVEKNKADELIGGRFALPVEKSKSVSQNIPVLIETTESAPAPERTVIITGKSKNPGKGKNLGKK